MATVITHPTDQDSSDYCAHSGCTCKVEPGQIYCSSECEEQSDEETCNCGHANCVPEVKDEEDVL